MSQQFARSCECLQQAFTIPAATPVSMSVDFDGASLPVTISGTFFYTSSGSVGTTTYASFTQTLKNSLDGLGSGYTINVAFNPAVGKVVISTDAGVGVFTIYVKNDGISPYILGMSAGQHNNATGGIYSISQITGSYTPSYVWRSSYSGRSKWKKPYEPQGFYTDAVADDGTTYSIGKEAGEIWSSWRWEFEPENHVRRESARALEPWTWQHAVEYMRATVPFIIHTSSVSNPTWTNKEGVYRLKGDSSNFNPVNQDPTFQTWLHLDCQVRVAGTGSSNGRF